MTPYLQLICISATVKIIFENVCILPRLFEALIAENVIRSLNVLGVVPAERNSVWVCGACFPWDVFKQVLKSCLVYIIMRYWDDLLPWSVELFFDVADLAGAAPKTVVVTTQTWKPDWVTVVDLLPMLWPQALPINSINLGFHLGQLEVKNA